MQFLKTLFWVILAVVIVIFAVKNWSPVSILIWQDIRADTKLPVLAIGSFLLGFFPMWLLHRTTKWRLARRIRTLENAAKSQVPPAPVGAGQGYSGDPTARPQITPAMASNNDDIAANSSNSDSEANRL